MFNKLIIIIFVALLATTTACVPNMCKQRATECKNDGVCVDGDCHCAAGFEGDSCQFNANKKFIGKYACVYTSTVNNGAPYYNDDTIIIKAGATRFDVKYYSVRDTLVYILNAKVTNTTINIPSQEIANVTTTGTGSLNNDTILSLTMFATTVIPTAQTIKTTVVGYKFK